MQKVRRGVFGLGVAGVLLMAVGCGSTASQTQTAGAVTTSAAKAVTTSAAKAATPSGKPVVLYTLVPISGPAGLELFPYVGDAAEAAAKAVNAAGGIQGRPVKVVVCDTKFDPNAEAACGRQAVAAKALAVVGGESNISGDYLPIVAAAGIPDVASSINTPVQTTNSLSFPIDSGAEAALAAAGPVCASQGGKTLRAAYAAFAVGKWAVDLSVPVGTTAAGIKRGPDVSVPTTTTDFSAAAASLMQGTDCVTFLMGTPQAAPMIEALRQAGFTGQIILDADVLNVKDIPALGAAANGVWIVSSVQPSLGRQMTAELKADNVKTPTIDGSSASAWVGVHLIANLLKKGPVTSAALIKALRKSGPQTIAPIAPFDLSQRVAEFPKGVNLYSSYVSVARIENGVVHSVLGATWSNFLHMKIPKQ
jgi:ABC-type branched-subunit amino acid transport system substrate-binding protein